MELFNLSMIGALVSLPIIQMVTSGDDEEDFSFLGSEMPGTEQILKEMLDGFREKISDEFTLSVQFNIQSPAQSWNISIKTGRKLSLDKGINHQAQFVFGTTEKVLQQIYKGNLSALTASGKANAADPAPLNFAFGEIIEVHEELREKLFFFLQHFFNRFSPEKIDLSESHSRMIHGGHAIPLYYHPGLRTAWYLVKKGERINEDGDINPFHQSITIIKGEGFAKIGEYNIRIKEGESYYIPPDSDHVVWTEQDEPMELIWMGWGDGA